MKSFYPRITAKIFILKHDNFLHYYIHDRKLLYTMQKLLNPSTNLRPISRETTQYFFFLFCFLWICTLSLQTDKECVVVIGRLKYSSLENYLYNNIYRLKYKMSYVNRKIRKIVLLIFTSNNIYFRNYTKK